MIVVYSKDFKGHLSKIKDATIAKRIVQTIDKLESANTLKDVSNVETIQGHPNYYRIRFGDYRIGIYHIETEQEVELVAVAHRSKIYNIFP
jgi:mRNA interferase RelE/StbE